LPTINVSEFGDGFVIHFDTDGERINAYTLASTLVGIADAAKAANNAVNFGYDIEVVVEAIGPGSFRALLRALYTQTGNLFSGESVRTIILGVVASFIYERTCAVDHPLKIEIKTDEVIIESGVNKVIVPRNVYDATRDAEKNPQFVRSIGKTLDSIAADNDVKSIGFVQKMDSPPPAMVIPRATIQSLDIAPATDPDTRVIFEQCELQMVKAILERSTRKWEFMWRGVRISAPIIDAKFYTDFFAHDITIAPGDELRVRLAIKQSRDTRTGIYTNIGYEVTDVYNHVPRLRQAAFPQE
jgi:hypothetical protein